ncbi:lipoate--protein ligase family protein [Halovenus marina]|uniref:lipoate--protein ligase family protein n=1 Tax=Halovenus marina TaxID=3396621 RepID=UPI003F560F83
MTDLHDGEWRFIPEQARSGPMQMALEEAAAETAAAGGPRTVRVFQWEPSTLSLGYRQAAETVDWEYCRQEGIDVTRRQTGGGGIYHDHDGDISYSIVAPESAVPGDLLESYELLCGPLFDALDRMGIDASFAGESQRGLYEPACFLREINPAHDVVVDGAKISGNAQYRQRDAVIQHGSLLYAHAADRHLGVFADPETAPDRFRDCVTTVREQANIDREEAVEALETTLGEWADATVGEWTAAELDRAREIAEEKYESDAWTRERTDPLDGSDDALEPADR